MSVFDRLGVVLATVLGVIFGHVLRIVAFGFHHCPVRFCHVVTLLLEGHELGPMWPRWPFPSIRLIIIHDCSSSSYLPTGSLKLNVVTVVPVHLPGTFERGRRRMSLCKHCPSLGRGRPTAQLRPPPTEPDEESLWICNAYSTDTLLYIVV